MALWKNSAFIHDPWRHVDEGEDAPPAGHVIMPLDWWKSLRGVFSTSNAPVGVRLEPGESVYEIAQDIPRLALIALSFPAYTDGRSFSKAQLLRQRFGFSGELRAIGDILTDQLQMLHRCGFDALEVSDGYTKRALEAGRVWNQTRFYQPSVAAERSAGSRPWLRGPDV